MERTLFHGSGTTVRQPAILETEYAKDFGFGFYCTESYEQAEHWAIRRENSQKGRIATVNVYSFELDASLHCKHFPSMSDEWLDFVAACRRGKPHDYDIVEGPMADDQIWDYVEDYLHGRISREAFWVLAQFKHPTHQTSFHTGQALKCLTFEKAVIL